MEDELQERALRERARVAGLVLRPDGNRWAPDCKWALVRGLGLDEVYLETLEDVEAYLSDLESRRM